MSVHLHEIRQCSHGICDGTGWREDGDDAVLRCPCAGGPPLCPVPDCGETAGEYPVCREHWRALPDRFRVNFLRAQRAWVRRNGSQADVDAAREKVLEAARQGVLEV